MLQTTRYQEELEAYVQENRTLFTRFANKSLLITGAAGLIGTYLIDLIITANRLLRTGIRVYAVDKAEKRLRQRFPEAYDDTVTHCVLDVNADDIPVSYADYVIHAASNTSPLDYAQKPIETMRTNMIGTDRMLQYCVRVQAKRFLFCSSVEAYGRNNGDVSAFTEDYSGYVDCNSLRAGYPSAKRASEALCNAYAKEYPDIIDFVIGRIGRIYGPTVIAGDTKAPTQFIGNAVQGQNIVMKSNGLQEFSYGYVGDCAIALLLILIDGASSEAYNIADGESVLLKRFAAEAAAAGGTQVVFEQFSALEAAGYSKITNAVMSIDKLAALGYRPRFTVAEGIARTVAHLKEE